MRPRVLCFLYYFPPSGGPGVLRGSKFAKYLPDAGIEPVVVTVRESTFDGPGEYARDDSTLAEVPPGVEVLRVPSAEPVRLKRWLVRAKLMRAAQMILYPLFWERQALWVLSAVRAALRYAARHRVDAIYTCCGPYCSNLIGLHLARRLGLPWITDHRDPFTESWDLHWPSRAHHRMCEMLEAEVLRRATRFVANTPTQREELLARFPFVRPDRVVAITNGYDEEDFAGPPPAAEEDRFVILHAGSFADRGGGDAPSAARRWLAERVEHRNRNYDLSTHSPRDLFRVLGRLRDGHPEVFTRLQVDLLGAGAGRWRELARRRGVEAAVRFLDPEPHRSAVARMRAAGLLFLPTTSRRDRRRVSRVSQKTYEYLRAGPPVLVTSGPGDARDFVLDAGAGMAAAPGDVEGQVGAVLRAFRAWDGGEPLDLVRREEMIRRFERRRLAGDMARVVREAVGAC